MKIGIDVRMIQDFPTGIGNYRENLVGALAKLSSEHQFVLIGNVGSKMEGWAKDRSRFGFVAVRSKPNSTHQHFLLPLELWPLKLDLFWTTPWGASVFLPLFNQKYALTIYDLLYRRYPELASAKARLYETLIAERVAQRAEVVFTISEFVKKDIVDFLDVEESRIFNIRGAAGEAFKPINNSNLKSLTLKKYGITQPFFVYLGNFRPHKNLATLLRAFARLKGIKGVQGVKLVLIGDVDAKGRGQDSQNLFNLFKQLNLQKDVILTGRIADDREVAAILNEALALVHPSFHEGFGLTVLEAMSCGCPVIAANTTSIPEVVGSAGLLVNPDSVGELTEAMRSLYHNYNIKSPEYQVRAPRGLEQAKKFSWKKTAKQVLGVFDDYRD